MFVVNNIALYVVIRPAEIYLSHHTYFKIKHSLMFTENVTNPNFTRVLLQQRAIIRDYLPVKFSGLNKAPWHPTRLQDGGRIVLCVCVPRVVDVLTCTPPAACRHYLLSVKG